MLILVIVPASTVSGRMFVEVALSIVLLRISVKVPASAVRDFGVGLTTEGLAGVSSSEGIDFSFSFTSLIVETSAGTGLEGEPH